MATEAMRIIEGQDWLQPAEESVQKAVNAAYEAGGAAGKQIQNVLNGTWLGHPLHPVMTDIPLGAWTTAAVLDCIESSGENRRGFGEAADAAVALGLVGAVGAAVTGITDWKDTQGKDRRAGFVHGILNTTAAALYVASLVARRKNDRSAGRALGMMGWSLMVMSAWIGGELVYRNRVGVDRSAEVDPLSEWTPLMGEAELPENELRRADCNGRKVLLLKRGNQIFAIGERCSHQGGPLAEGKLEGDCVTCPWHGSVFSLKDGSVVDGPATMPQPAYELRSRDGQIEVRQKV